MNDRHQESVRWSFTGSTETPSHLVGTLAYTGQPGPAAVLYVHGFGSRHDGQKGQAIAKTCAELGWTYAAFSFRGHGESSGSLLQLSGSVLQEDLEQIRTFLADRGVQWIFPVGSSMGGWASAWFALRHRAGVPACVAIAPAYDFLERRWNSLTEAERQSWKETGRLRVQNEWLDVEIGYGLVEERESFTFSELIRRWHTPVLIHHGMDDIVIPYRVSLQFTEQVTHPKVELRLYKDGDHRLLNFKEQLAQSACAFFKQWWPG